MKKYLDEKEWLEMNVMLNENTKVGYNLSQAFDEMGQRYDSHANHLDLSMIKLNLTSNTMPNVISILVPTTTAKKVKVPKTSTQGAVFGTNERPSSYTVGDHPMVNQAPRG
ncbi:hypothetical protein ACH5RR_026124 [Cinchona calisaya]|uniref:Uncharacterized protein n=1 Tax=Cinchona calisaya TaxID=153742 RepID=A0ABD2Z5M3_9GENT